MSGDVDEFQPTVRALQEQYKNLCKRAGVAKGRDGKVNDTPGKPRSTPNATPRKSAAAVGAMNPKTPTAPKTPSSGTKRSHKTTSDEAGSEGESLYRKSESAKRTRYDRRSKTPKTYEDPGSDDEDAIDMGLGGQGSSLGSIFDQDLSLGGAADDAAEDNAVGGGGRRAMRRKWLDDDAMSEISEFNPELS